MILRTLLVTGHRSCIHGTPGCKLGPERSPKFRGPVARMGLVADAGRCVIQPQRYSGAKRLAFQRLPAGEHTFRRGMLPCVSSQATVVAQCPPDIMLIDVCRLRSEGRGNRHASYNSTTPPSDDSEIQAHIGHSISEVFKRIRVEPEHHMYHRLLMARTRRN